jgi:hypothetical protein
MDEDHPSTSYGAEIELQCYHSKTGHEHVPVIRFAVDYTLGAGESVDSAHVAVHMLEGASENAESNICYEVIRENPNLGAMTWYNYRNPSGEHGGNWYLGGAWSLTYPSADCDTVALHTWSDVETGSLPGERLIARGAVFTDSVAARNGANLILAWHDDAHTGDDSEDYWHAASMQHSEAEPRLRIYISQETTGRRSTMYR